MAFGDVMSAFSAQFEVAATPTMIKNIQRNLKKLSGFASTKQEEFDQAMLAVLNAAADSRIYLSAESETDDAAEKVANIAHAWSDAAVKINRINDELCGDCLDMIRFFSEIHSAASERTTDGRTRIDGVLEKAGRFLQKRQKKL